MEIKIQNNASSLADFIRGVNITVFSDSKTVVSEYRISAEERENHPGYFKAVLSECVVIGSRVKWSKINVWKPGSDSPKLETYFVPYEIMELFEACKDVIESAEKASA